jgi:hypothetical protein
VKKAGLVGITVLSMAAISLLAMPAARADRGSIPFKHGVEIFEPKQRAMLAWNGEEEIMLLSTDIAASESTQVLEVLPLPSEPEVKKGDVSVFARAAQLITSKLGQAGAPRGVSPGGKTKSPAGEVAFHEKIGSHDISVTHVLDPIGFVAWVEDYLDSANVQSPVIPDPLREVVEEYVEDGFTWFVFDVVDLSESTRTLEAIQYRFKSDRLYYPLRITRTETGTTEIELLILTHRLLNVFRGISHQEVLLTHEPVTLTGAELWGLSMDMYNLLGKPDEAKLRIWKIRGDLPSFKKDLLAE